MPWLLYFLIIIDNLGSIVFSKYKLSIVDISFLSSLECKYLL
jgi:hypothetical protein